MSSAVPSPGTPTVTRPDVRPPVVAGSTHVRVARSSARERAARSTRGRRVRLTARASVLGVVVLILLTLSVAPLRTLLDQRSELSHLERRTALLEERNARLQERIAQLNDPAYLEGLARGCLGMVEPGETAFVLVPREGAPPTPQC